MNRKSRGSADHVDDVQSVTTAAAGRSQDLRSRQNRYLWMMGIRIICLPLAVVTTGWLRVVFIIGAVVLPYIAVVVVNAASRPAAGTIESVTPTPRAELPAGTRSSEPNDQNDTA